MYSKNYYVKTVGDGDGRFVNFFSNSEYNLVDSWFACTDFRTEELAFQAAEAAELTAFRIVQFWSAS